MYRALVVDDEKMIRMGIKHGIPWKETGIEEVYTARSAQEAIQMIDEYRPEVMITDISMTEMTGLDLIQEIRKKNKQMRIIVLTGYDRFDYARQCLQMGVQNFLLKPADEDELSETVREQVKVLDEMRLSKEKDSNKSRAEGSKRQMDLEMVMNRLIQGKAAELEDKLDEIRRDYHFEQDKDMCIVILLSDLYINSNEVEETFRVLSAKNICISLIDARNKGITFMDSKGNLVIAFFTDGTASAVTEEVRQLTDILEDEYSIKPKTVLGSQIKGFENLYVSYNDAVYLLDNERSGFQDMVKSKTDKKREDIFQDIYAEFKKEMEQNITNSGYMLHVFESFKKASQSYNLSQPHIRKCCFELASAVFFSYSSETGEILDMDLNGLMKLLASAGKEEIFEITENFLRKFLKKEESDFHVIVSKARHYIDEHLDADLSVTSIAGDFYVSPNYFSRLFKRVTGEGCNEYIVRRRIEKSISLLETTTIKAGKIAMMVGYHDINYFSIAFKKHTGMSPTKYRKMAEESR